MIHTYTIIGGDLRQTYLMEALKKQGHTVYHWGLSPSEDGSYEALVRDSDVILLPLPVSSLEESFLKELFPQLTGKIVLGGMVSSFVKALGEIHGVTVYDYYDSEAVQQYNAIPTVEGAIALTIQNRHKTIWNSSCLITGYGRIGKLLACRLRALGADVTVAARRESDRAAGRAMGHCMIPFERLYEVLPKVEILYNTVPSPIFDRSKLTLLPEDCLLMELASKPGGFAPEALEGLSRTYIPAGGLPGKVTPKTAAEILQSSIEHILANRKEGE